MNLDFLTSEEKFTQSYKDISIRAFGKYADQMLKSFERLRPALAGTGSPFLLRTWICMTILSTVLGFVIALFASILLSLVFAFDFALSLYITIFAPTLTAAFVFMGFYIYPLQKAHSIEKNIEIDMPFALAHMSAIASSGIPPEFMFHLLTGFEEYRGISHQAKMVVRNINTFGMSSVAAIENVSQKTPSYSLKQVLSGLTVTIEKGGDTVTYLKEMADKALFDYRVKREQYLKTLSTYADIYTALLVAAPLMMLAVLGIMSIIGGEILGLSIQDLIGLITWVLLPLLNIIFLTFIHITYPGM